MLPCATSAANRSATAIATPAPGQQLLGGVRAQPPAVEVDQRVGAHQGAGLQALWPWHRSLTRARSASVVSVGELVRCPAGSRPAAASVPSRMR